MTNNFNEISSCYKDFLNSLKEQFSFLSEEEKIYLRNIVEKYKKKKHQYNWDILGRPHQHIPEGNWRLWLIIAGRGFGKTRMGAQSIRSWVLQGKCRNIAFIGNTLEEARNIMVQGESGLLSCCAPWEGVQFLSGKNQVLWPCGAKISLFSAQCWDKLRGPQFDGVWIDEFAKFPDPKALWDQVMFSLRLGQNPQAIITTTPRPLPFLNDLIEKKTTIVTRGTTMDNIKNLSPGFLDHLEENYKGNPLWQQEVCGQILPQDSNEYLWRPDLLHYKNPPENFTRVVIALDPAVTSGKKSDETGLVVTGLDENGHCYVLEDFSGRMTPQGWAKAAWDAWNLYKNRSPWIQVVAEVNNGGDIVQELLKTLYPEIPYKSLRARVNKILRAQPALRLYERKKVFHSRVFLELEGKMINPQKFHSPDRMDALVWSLHTLMPEKKSNIPEVL